MTPSCRMRRVPCVVLALVLASACSGYDAALDVEDEDLDGASQTGGTDSGEGDETEEEWGSYWSLDADLLLVDGQVDPAGSLVYLGRRRDGEQTCLDTVALTGAQPAEELPHDTVWTWWELTWDTAGLTCFSSSQGGRNQPFLLGIGQLHTEILAVLEGIEDVASGDAGGTLSGAYLQLPGDERLLVYGAAGPPEAWAGKGSAATGSPLADGTWWVRTAYSLPLAW